ncbi:MAG: NAD(P)H-hydrate dehydratase [Vicingaceae bacterium]|nr:NAD(P)H-hydrate dehydratase [Vicingaceae bacterium]
MKILTAKQTREADAYTIKNEPIASIDLMERASKNCFDWLISKYGNKTHFTFFCGVGNNGGDGLAIARMLHYVGCEVNIYIVDFSDNHSQDFEINKKRLRDVGLEVSFLTDNNHQIEILLNSILIDSIFGSGLTRPIDGFISKIVTDINNYNNEVISIDIPSGLFSESNINNREKNIVSAKYTLTFQQPKLAMLFPQNYKYVGDFEVLDISLDQEYLSSVETNYYYISKEIIKSILHQRTKFSHKGNYGHALLIAGSKGKMGASILAALACLRTGLGLLTVQVPKVGYEIMQTSVPEAMNVIDDSEDYISNVIDTLNYDVIGIGPGIGKEELTKSAFKLLIQNSNKPMVIDADALNILSENLTWFSFLPSLSILTPHPREFQRLVGKWNNDEERLQLQIETSIKNNVIIVLKGANTSISMPDSTVYFNSTGNPGMATGGSGDVLTGMITGLLAQGYMPKDAAIFGVYLHGLAGDFAMQKIGINSIIASDIVNNISNAYQSL